MTRPSLRERIERAARHRHLRLVRGDAQRRGPGAEDGDHDIARGKVRPLGVAPARWIDLRDRGMPESTFRAELRELVDEIADELYRQDTPPRAA